MSLSPIQSTRMLDEPTNLGSPPLEYYVWINIEEMVDGESRGDVDWGYGKIGTYTNLTAATARAEWVEALVNKVKYVRSPDGLGYWVARAAL